MLLVSNPKNSIEIFAVDSLDGSLQWLETQHNVQAWPLTFSPNGKSLYAKNIIFDRDSMSGKLTRVDSLNSSEFGMNASAVSPDGRYFYRTGSAYISFKSVFQLAAYNRDPATGYLQFSSKIDIDGTFVNYATRGLRVSPDGRHIYAATVILYPDLNPDSDDIYIARIRVFEKDDHTDTLKLVETLDFGLLNEISNIEMTTDGLELYVTTRRDNFAGTLLVIERNPDTGKLYITPKIIQYSRRYLWSG